MPSMIWWQARRHADRALCVGADGWGTTLLAVGAVVLAVGLGADWGVRIGAVVGYGALVGWYEYRLLRHVRPIRADATPFQSRRVLPEAQPP
jgi:acyl dehydratase